MNIVKELRKKRGIQQKELAIVIGVSRPIVSEWESQKKDPSGPRLKKLAAYFGVDELEILGVEKKDPAANGGPEADGDLATMIQQFSQLSPAEKQRVLDFAAGILSSHGQ